MWLHAPVQQLGTEVILCAFLHMQTAPGGLQGGPSHIHCVLVPVQQQQLHGCPAKMADPAAAKAADIDELVAQLDNAVKAGTHKRALKLSEQSGARSGFRCPCSTLVHAMPTCLCT